MNENIKKQTDGIMGLIDLLVADERHRDSLRTVISKSLSIEYRQGVLDGRQEMLDRLTTQDQQPKPLVALDIEVLERINEEPINIFPKSTD